MSPSRPLPLDATARALIQTLDLAPHPEGGWYRETWRAPAIQGARPASTAILFLLPAGENSHWHRVDADEIWAHQAGAPLLLEIVSTDGKVDAIRLGSDIAAGDQPQAVVPLGQPQAARPLGAWSLAACIVAPGFEFTGFELAPPNWTPGQAWGNS
jgi:predicted cupin superfamily sugar epimerase